MITKMWMLNVITYLVMVRPEHDPTTETIPEVDHGRTTAESDHVWECCP